jgi:archaetidylinositol phosphate synthase
LEGFNFMSAVHPHFRDAKRIQTSFLANIEKRTLIWLAAHTPRFINSDHLTALGLFAMAGAGASYWWAGRNKLGLVFAIFFLALNWLGDSLDGTLARYRDCCRPRYGFYVDHVVDALSALFLLGGLGLSGYMSLPVAMGLLIAYLLVSIEVYLATYTLGNFRISYFKMGPTELRILLCVGNLALFWKRTVHLFGQVLPLFDAGGLIGTVGLLVVLCVSAARNTAALYRSEPVNHPPSRIPAVATLKFPPQARVDA